ncbi:MAG: hypothetical protein ACLUNZ_01865 [Evtepia sp.]
MLQEVVNIPFLRSFLKKQEKDRAERQEQERERIKLEKKAQAEAKRKAQERCARSRWSASSTRASPGPAGRVSAPTPEAVCMTRSATPPSLSGPQRAGQTGRGRAGPKAGRGAGKKRQEEGETHSPGSG